MLHGATSAALEDWAAQRPLFRKAFRLYLVDARGHAGTKWDVRDGFTRDMMVDDLLAFADALGLETFHLVGFSMGAMTALTFATRYPERLRTAIISGIDIVREPRSSVARRLMDPERIEREEPAWAAQLEKRHGPVQGEGAWKRLLPAIVDDVAAQPLLTFEDLRRIRLPGPARLRRPRCLCARRPCRGDLSPVARRATADRAEQPAHGDGRAARPVQPGRRELLPIDREGRARAGRAAARPERSSACGPKARSLLRAERRRRAESDMSDPFSKW